MQLVILEVGQDGGGRGGRGEGGSVSGEGCMGWSQVVYTKQDIRLRPMTNVNVC